MDTMEVKDFDFGTADIDAFLNKVVGLNIIFRTKMRAVMKQEENEMVKLREIFDDIVRREEEQGAQLMTPAFRAGFITLFNMNVTPENQIRR